MSKHAKTAAAALGILVLGNVDALATVAGGGGTCTGSGCNCNGTGSTATSENHAPGDPSKPLLSFAFANDSGFDFSFHLINDAEATLSGPIITVEGGTLKTTRSGIPDGWIGSYSDVTIPETGDPFFCRRSDVSPAIYASISGATYTMYLYQSLNAQEIYKGQLVHDIQTPTGKFCNTKGIANLIIAAMPSCD